MIDNCPTCGREVPAGQRTALAAVLEAVSEVSEVSVADLKGPRRQYALVHPRWIAILLMREHCPQKSLPQIGRFLGNRDHTTIMHGASRAEELIKTDERARDIYERAKRRLGLA